MARDDHDGSYSESVPRDAADDAGRDRTTPQRSRWSTRRKVRVGFTALGAAALALLVALIGLNAFGGNHTLGSVDYAQIPPHSGDHSPVTQRCGFYSEPVGDEHAVHSLEHGVVWITYHPDLPQAQVDGLRELERTQEYMIVSPYPDLPAPVVISAWEQQTHLESASDPRLVELIGEYRNSPLAPEPDGGCEGPNLWVTGSTGDPEP